jgi:hypothetical protein
MRDCAEFSEKMYYTEFQKEILNEKKISKIVYRKMWEKNRDLGYSNKGTNTEYFVNIASDCPNKDIQEIVLIHELAHNYFGHHDINFDKELKDVKDLFKLYNKSYSLIHTYGGPLTFLNVCMDLEVNSKALTIANIRKMRDEGIFPYTPGFYGVEVLDDFRDYYIPLIEKLSPEDSHAKDLKVDSKNDSFNLNDLPSFISSEDAEIQKELEKENYCPGEERAKRRDIERIADIGEVLVDDSEKSDNSPNQESSNSANRTIEIVENTDKNICKFLSSIIGIDFQYSQDSIKHYIRGTRKNDQNILYKAQRRKLREFKKKLSILIDCSGSMKTSSLLKALGSLKEGIKYVSPHSRIITWDYALQEEFSIDSIPSTIRVGGGTDIASGLKYLIDDRATDIVIYSDMETDTRAMIDLIKRYKANVYTIIVKPSKDNKDLEEYMSLNKKTLCVY